MDGAWERPVQSVRKAMSDAYAKKKLTDKGLQTLVVEAEHLANPVPLTYLLLESEQAETLMPNHFLLLNSIGLKTRMSRS